MSQPPPQKPAVFIDADALIAGSASNSGASHLILQLSELGLIDAVCSEQVRRESERNLTTKLPAAIPAFRLLADAAVRWVGNPRTRELENYRGQADPEDLPILVAALQAGCDSLITFNVRHYWPKDRALRIETPGDFLTRLRRHLEELSEQA